jgi:hypothetical protein
MKYGNHFTNTKPKKVDESNPVPLSFFVFIYLVFNLLTNNPPLFNLVQFHFRLLPYNVFLQTCSLFEASLKDLNDLGKPTLNHLQREVISKMKSD